MAGAEETIKKSDGTETQRLHGIVDLDDAAEAGGRNSENCTLILTDRISGSFLARLGRVVLGYKFYGVYALRDKLPNVWEASSNQIYENEDIQNIIKILGLQPHKEYTNVKSLRYGHLMIMADQNHDGYHFKGLLINFIYFFWPSLLKVPSFMVEFTTPIIQAFHSDGRKLSFYSMPDFEGWNKLGNNANEWRLHNYLGLASNTREEGIEYFRALDEHRKVFVWEDDEDGSAIELAFSKEKAEDRKTWICNFKRGTCRDYSAKSKSIRYRDFVNKELILFFRAEPQRSIASMIDGLKPPQRKILFCSFKKKLFEEIHVDEFIHYAVMHSTYHNYHNMKQSLASAIINMAHDYVGSNNINLLKPISKSGTCNTDGSYYSDGNYFYTELSPITRCLFSEDDDELLDYLNEDGRSIEPNWYMPVIPMVLVNGSEGISTGLSSFVPNYNPREIIANIRRLLNGGEVEPMNPWYKGFKGSIQKSAEEGGYVINGTIEKVDDQTYRITELPIRRWTEDYERFLISVADTAIDAFIEDFFQNGDDVTVDIEVKLKQDKIAAIKQEGLLKKFKLTRTISTSNMHLFDAEGKIKKYDNPEQILKEFYQLRLEYYERRKKHKLKNLEQLLLVLDDKIRLISKRHGEFDFKMEQADDKSAEPQVTRAMDDNSEEQEIDCYEDLKILKDLPTSMWKTVLDELAQKVLKEREEKTRELKILKATSPTSMWDTDLDELEKKLDELERKEAEDERKRSSPATKAAIKAAASRKRPKSMWNIPLDELLNKLDEERKRSSQATKAAPKKRPETSNSSMEVVVETEE